MIVGMLTKLWADWVFRVDFTRQQRFLIFILQPFAKRLAVTNLGNYENKQYTTDPKLGFAPPGAQYSTMNCYRIHRKP
jgi:hypothetical protein